MGLYDERLQRTFDAVSMKKVDKIPFSYSGPAYIARAQGLSIADALTKIDLATTAVIDFLHDHPGIDTMHNPVQNPYGLSILWLSQIKLPGEELPDDELWQLDEKELMTEEDYQTIIDEGYGPWAARFMKEKIGDPIGKMAPLQPERAKVNARIKEEADVAVINGALGGTPIEGFCGARTLMNFFMDIMDEPELVKAAMDKAFEFSFPNFCKTLETNKPIGTWVGGWRAAPNLMSHETFMEYVWPYEVQYVNAAIERGVLPILHFDSPWDSELETLRELPARKCLLMLDGSTDIRLAREVLGDHMAIQGDVPATLLAMGTENETYEYVTKLIDDVGSSTGLIVSSGCDCPLNAKKENVDAMVQATVDYQVR